jgi:hypothetical protein
VAILCPFANFPVKQVLKQFLGRSPGETEESPLKPKRAHGGWGATRESRDGKILYFEKGGGLWKISIDGGEESKVLDSIHQNCFAVGEKGIYFIPKADETGQFSIQFYNVSSGKTQRIAGIPKERYLGFGFDVSPDGRSILCTLGGGPGGSDLMLVENFR